MKGQFAPNLWREGRTLGSVIRRAKINEHMECPRPESGRGNEAPNSSVSEGQDQCSWSP